MLLPTNSELSSNFDIASLDDGPIFILCNRPAIGNISIVFFLRINQSVHEVNGIVRENKRLTAKHRREIRDRSKRALELDNVGFDGLGVAVASAIGHFSLIQQLKGFIFISGTHTVSQ